jgi:Flp pilus assembly pilin Flp
MKNTIKNKKGQAVVEYVMLLSVVAMLAIFGFSYVKCQLHTIWITNACDILYPYPYQEAEGDLSKYCTPLTDCMPL